MDYPIGTQTQLWQNLLKTAQTACQVKLNENMESYLVFMLIRFMRAVDLKDIFLAAGFLESLLDSGRNREIVSNTADASLLLAGWYPERARRRNLSLGYFIEISATCFLNLADVCEKLKRPGEASLYKEVGTGVPKLATVLCAARGVRQNIPMQEGALLSMYQLPIPHQLH